MDSISKTFVAALEAFARQEKIPVIPFRRGQRKDDVAAEQRKSFHKTEGGRRSPIAWIVGTTLFVSVAAAQTLDCAQCHDQPHTIIGIAHASVGCLTCHRNHDQFPHPEGIPKPECANCHQDEAAQNRLGIHGRARAQGKQAAPDCAACHGNIHQVRRTGTQVFRQAIPSICGRCHNQVNAQYEQSVHGKAVAAGIIAAPVCSTCHGEHQIQPPAVSTSPVNPLHIPETCGRCHGDVALARKFDLPRDTVVSYEASFHGLALKAGQETVANCATCHGTQGQMRHADPTTTLRYYVKVIPENQRKAVADFERSVMKKGARRRSKAEPNR